MSKAIKHVVIVGGGSAGWLTAGTIAAEHKSNTETGLKVTLIESPDVEPIGVGEGTWPTMRGTLAKIGVSETDLFKECEASFKQGAKFVGWVTGKPDDFYYHPLVMPHGYGETDLASQWHLLNDNISFADAVSSQGQLCENGLAPKQISTPEYAAVANYAYHLNSVKLGQFLQKHCVEKLGVNHILDHVTQINSAENGDIASLSTKASGNIEGDLFIDCSGLSSLLLGQHYETPFVSCKDILFNDTALAVQVPYPTEDTPIVSHTVATAQNAGWIWDIGLPSRRGVGYAFSSAHSSDEAAELELRQYIEPAIGKAATDKLDFRKISINPGHRAKLWHKNCVAVGMASGFLEPLEASALMLIELASSMISEGMPATREAMDVVANRYNERFLYRWDRIIEFLKFHYILTRRTDTDYWVDNCREETIPQRLQDLVQMWKVQPPSRFDFPQVEEVFGSASWQYVLYGMDFKTQSRATEMRSNDREMAHKLFSENAKMTAKYLSALPTNRELINKIQEFGMQKV